MSSKDASATVAVAGGQTAVSASNRNKGEQSSSKPHLAGVQARQRKRIATFIILAVLLVLSLIANAVMGQFKVQLDDVFSLLGSKMMLSDGPDDPTVTSVLWLIRFPRIVLGVIVGACLAVAGSVMQSLFSNPLAEPGIIGVSSGSAVGASLMILIAPAALGGFAVPIGAFIAGIITSFLVYFLSRSGGKAEAITLVLTGIAVTAVCAAITSMTTFIAPVTARDQIVFWQMGSLNGAQWFQVGIVAIIAVIGIIWAISLAGKLDALALGEKAAGHVGVNVHRLRVQAISLTALLTAAAVSYAGVISFVGLIVPHVLRLAIGPANKFLIPASLLGGALLITLSDLAARTLIPFADMPIGIFTAFVGGPTFFVLLRRGLHLAKKG